FPLLATAVHSGGERYDTGLPVENRFGGGGGMTVDRSVPGFFSRFSFSLMALGSARQVRDTAFRSMSGFGLLARIGITPGDFDCSATCFKGRNIDMPVGNPVYRSNRPLYVLEVSRKYRQGETFSAEGGVRLEIVESSMRSFCSNPQHRWWVALQGNFSHFFGRRVD
ncbi:MAG: hypothetical protein JXA71_20460, partial [Chitinispirillaceae bacterium]|nr:hypothetical protein [Chitinispirillaceae bacterium]